MRKTTVTVTEGKDFFAVSFEKPITELEKYAYNGADLIAVIGTEDAKTFWDKGQSIDFYNGCQLVYSCRVTEVKYKKRWRKIILDAWNAEGKEVFNYEKEYRQLLDEITK